MGRNRNRNRWNQNQDGTDKYIRQPEVEQDEFEDDEIEDMDESEFIESVEDELVETVHEDYFFREDEQVVRYMSMDAAVYNGILREAPTAAKGIQQVSTLLGLKPYKSAALHFDFFTALSRINVDPSGYGDTFAKTVVSQFMAHPKWTELREYTISDDTSAALAAGLMVSSFAEKVDNEIRDAAVKAEATARAKLEAEAILDVLEADPTTDPDELKDAQSKDKAATLADKQAQRDLASVLRVNKSKIDNAIEDTLSIVVDGVETMLSASEWAGTEMGEDVSIPIEGSFQMAKAISNKEQFQTLVKMLGAFIESNDKRKRSSMRFDSGSVVSITSGGELLNITESELSSLSHPKLRKLALSRIADDMFDAYEVEAKMPADRGDAIVMVDESGSMSDRTEVGGIPGTVNEEAKAFALCIAHVCLKHRRRADIITFESAVTWHKKFDWRDKSEAATNMAMLACRGARGGTCFDTALKFGMNVFDGPRFNRENGDMVLITDGCSSISYDTIRRAEKMKRNHGTTFVGILVGKSLYGDAGSTLRQVCDIVITTSEIFGGEAMEVLSVLDKTY